MPKQVWGQGWEQEEKYHHSFYQIVQPLPPERICWCHQMISSHKTATTAPCEGSFPQVKQSTMWNNLPNNNNNQPNNKLPSLSLSQLLTRSKKQLERLLWCAQWIGKTNMAAIKIHTKCTNQSLTNSNYTAKPSTTRTKAAHTKLPRTKSSHI